MVGNEIHEFRWSYLSFIGEKWKNLPLLGRTREWYRYQKLDVPVPMGQRQSGTGIDQSGTDTHTQ